MCSVIMHRAFIPPARSPGRVALPLFASRIPAGFPSPADDYVEARLDLNELLVQRQEATYFLRVKGDSMQGAGIHPGDLIVVDRSIEAHDGSVVVAEVDGALTIKRLRLGGEAPELHPDNPAYPVIRCKEGQELRIWGVVTSSVHTVR
jgi:DNA polymerase V